MKYQDSLDRSKPHSHADHDDFVFFEDTAPLGKNIGHITYPEFGEGQLRNLTGYFPEKGFKGSMAAKKVGFDNDSAPDAFHRSNYRKDPKLSVPEAQRIVSIVIRNPKAFPHNVGSVAHRLFPEQVGEMGHTKMGVAPGVLSPAQERVLHNVLGMKQAHGTESHEVQHGVFARLKQRYGKDIGTNVLRETLNR